MSRTRRPLWWLSKSSSSLAFTGQIWMRSKSGLIVMDKVQHQPCYVSLTVVWEVRKDWESSLDGDIWAETNGVEKFVVIFCCFLLFFFFYILRSFEIWFHKLHIFELYNLIYFNIYIHTHIHRHTGNYHHNQDN